MTNKLRSGDRIAPMRLPRAGGGEVVVGGPREGWQMVVVYRGLHCPICRRYLARIEGLRDAFAEAGTEIVAVSADTEEQAEAARTEWGIGLDIGYGMDEARMRALGLYVSQPRSEAETDHLFPEPGLFVLNPAGEAHMIEIANAPFIRPDPEQVLSGLRFVQEKGYPVRGTA